MGNAELTDLTVRQQHFVRGYLEGKPITVAAVEAGYAPTTAARGAAEMLRSPKVRSAIQGALEAAGVTEDRLAAVINGGLEATKTTHIVVSGQIQTLESPDWAARHRFADMVLRLRSAYPATEVDITATTYEDRLRQIMGRLQQQEQA